VDIAVLCAVIRDRTITRIPGVAADLDHVMLYSAALGVPISQACYATGENHDRSVIRQLFGELDLEVVLFQADTLHAQRSVEIGGRKSGFGQGKD
jgi:hypothetical protein